MKSPPELWAEISDVAMLARRLGEFGEIRITRIEAETTVAWEGDRACGTVELQASGWGTKVTITAKAVEGAEPPAEVAEVLEAVVVDETPEAEMDVSGTDGEEDPAGAEEAAIAAATPAPKRGFFARLLRRRRVVEVAEVEVVAEAEVEVEVTPEPEAISEPEEVVPAVEPEPAAEAQPEPAAEPPLDEGAIEAILVGALDDLGAAHHRPFSRG